MTTERSPRFPISPKIDKIGDMYLNPYSVYDQIAGHYDSAFISPLARAENDIIRALLIQRAIHNGKTVVDLGSGTGFLLDLIPLMPSRYIGIDASPNMIQVARSKHSIHTFQHGFMEDLPVRSNSVDLAVSLFGSFSYANPIEAIPELYRVLTAGGKFFIMVYTPRILKKRSYILNKMGVQALTTFYDAHYAREYFSKFDKVVLQGFHWMVEPLFRWVRNKRLLKFLLSTEMDTMGRTNPASCYYMIIEGEKHAQTNA